MLVLRFVLMVLCLLVLGAHLFRARLFLFVLPCILALPFVFIPRRWTIWPVQALLLFGCLEWVATLITGVQERIHLGRPWLRMALIIGGVAALTVACFLFPFFGRMRAYYRRGIDRRRATRAEP